MYTQIETGLSIWCIRFLLNKTSLLYEQKTLHLDHALHVEVALMVLEAYQKHISDKPYTGIISESIKQVISSVGYPPLSQEIVFLSLGTPHRGYMTMTSRPFTGPVTCSLPRSVTASEGLTLVGARSGFHPMRFSTPRILSFLQSGLEHGLALSSLNGQVPALSVLFQQTLAFLQGTAHLCLSYLLSCWALESLVLEALQVSPF